MFSNKLKTVSRSASLEISLFVWVFECLVEVCPEHEPWGWCATCFHLNNCCRRFSSNQKHVFFHLNEEFLINKHSLSPLMQLYFNLRATDQKKTHLNIFCLYIFSPRRIIFIFLNPFICKFYESLQRNEKLQLLYSSFQYMHRHISGGISGYCLYTYW